MKQKGLLAKAPSEAVQVKVTVRTLTIEGPDAIKRKAKRMGRKWRRSMQQRYERCFVKPVDRVGEKVRGMRIVAASPGGMVNSYLVLELRGAALNKLLKPLDELDRERGMQALENWMAGAQEKMMREYMAKYMGRKKPFSISLEPVSITSEMLGARPTKLGMRPVPVMPERAKPLPKEVEGGIGTRMDPFKLYPKKGLEAEEGERMADEGDSQVVIPIVLSVKEEGLKLYFKLFPSFRQLRDSRIDDTARELNRTIREAAMHYLGMKGIKQSGKIKPNVLPALKKNVIKAKAQSAVFRRYLEANR